MKRIAVLTTTRADYGLLSPVIKKLSSKKELVVSVLVTGSHLSPEFGMTVNEILKDDVNIDKKIEILLSSDTSAGISKAMGISMISFSDYFTDANLDALLVLGDRFECLSVCLTALVFRIPIIHLHGGEITEGAIDNAIRHSITKLSCLHFTSTEDYRKRVIQMGENPDCVFNFGAVGVENVLSEKLYTKEEAEKLVGMQLDKYAVLTFHPVTLENKTAEAQTLELLKVLISHKEITFICTKANADTNGRIINSLLKEYSEKYSNIKLYDSLGSKLYLSLVKYAQFVIGNSSSGIIEVPSFKIPTINIGDRQKGRVQAKTIINCEPVATQIDEAISYAESNEFKTMCKNANNPYEGENTSSRISDVVYDYLVHDKLVIKKKFYDI